MQYIDAKAKKYLGFLLLVAIFVSYLIIFLSLFMLPGLVAIIVSQDGFSIQCLHHTTDWLTPQEKMFKGFCKLQITRSGSVISLAEK